MSNEVTTVKPQRQAVMAAEPIFDTAMFEHMARIASTIATSSLLPAHLRVMKDAEGREVKLADQDRVACWLDERATTANAFLIVSAARNFGGMDPFALAQSSYFVHGRLGYEGKLVQAMIERRVGAMEFKYNDANPTSEDFGITVTAWVPNALPERQASVTGTVRDWASRKNGALNQQWKGEGGARRMLHYRGTREWARLYAPALVLGLLDDDDLEAMREDLKARSARQLPAPSRAFNPLAADQDEAAEQLNELGRGRVEEALAGVTEALKAGADPETGEIAQEKAQDGQEQGPAPDTAQDPAAAAGDPPLSTEEVDVGHQRIELKPSTKRLPRGFPQRVDVACMKLVEAKDMDALRAAWDQYADPLVVEIETGGFPTPSVDRLKGAYDARKANFDTMAKANLPAETKPETQAAEHTKAGNDGTTVPDFQVQLDHLRDELLSAQSLDDVDDVLASTLWIEEAPGGIQAEVDDAVAARRKAIVDAAKAGDAAAPVGTVDDAAPAPTQDELGEMVSKWISDMRRIRTVQELDQYNVDHVTPFMQGPHASLLDKDELASAKDTFATRRRLLVNREDEAKRNG